MTFRLYDSATRTTRPFVPLVPGKVSIYHCGLTVQSAPHLGHIRKEVVFDVLRRWLTASGYDVTVVANVTDIDDKILAKSAEAGVPWFAHAYRFERELHAAYAALGCEPPTYEPRATGHIPEMIELVEILLERGHAYVAEDGSGDVYFDVRSWPAYGELSNQRVDDMAPAEDADPRGKRDPRDFALWKGWKESEPRTASWPAPWGRGRPGWHLECSAMAGKYLGDAFDIHGGGLDLRFPHHENELAQSRAAGRPFASYWMHNAWVTAAGEKMSKSLSNGALVSEVTKQFPARAVRFYLAQPHYRSAVEYSETSLAEATASLERIDTFVERALDALGRPLAPLTPPDRVEGPSSAPEPVEEPSPAPEPLEGPSPAPEPLEEPSPAPEPVEGPSPASGPIEGPSSAPEPVEEPSPAPEPVEGHPRPRLPEAFTAAMDDDLGTSGAVAVLYGVVRDGNQALTAGDLPAVEAALDSVRSMLWVLGLDAADPAWAGTGSGDAALRPVVDGLVSALLDQRSEARARKDYAAADAIRERLSSLGLTITDTPSGPKWSL